MILEFNIVVGLEGLVLGGDLRGPILRLTMSY